jgi:flavin reductase (DIM6/NTAB) family NADH-FMN oxidoreductase RutF
VDERSFRKAMGTFPTGVTVVTARAGEDDPVGLTVNAFTSVSLDPPLVLVCIDRASGSHDRIVSAGAFAVNVLSSAQGALARRFASDPASERFTGVPWRSGPGGAPVLEGAVAWLACTLHAAHAAGDHTILVGRVEAVGAGEGEALAFYRGAFTAMTEP